MDIDHQNNKEVGVRGGMYQIESELVIGGGGAGAEAGASGDRCTVIRDTILENTQQVTPLSLFGAAPVPLYLPKYDLPEQNSPVVLAGRVEESENRNQNRMKVREHDSSSSTSPPSPSPYPYDQSTLNNGIPGDASGKSGNSKYAIQNGDELDLAGSDNKHIPKEVQAGGQRSRGISINDLLVGQRSLPRIQSHTHPQSFSTVSTPTSVSPATPEDFPSPYAYAHYPPGSILSPVPRPRSSLGSTARPISNRRPGAIHTPRSRASPYLTSAARNEGVGLGINMLNSPSTPGNMSRHSNSPLSMGPGNSPGSMSARRRKAPEWPEPKSARSHSFGQSTSSTPRDMFQTLRTPAALRVPTTAQLLSRPGDVGSPMLIPGSASGLGPMRRGMPPSSAPPLSARLDTQSPLIPQTPRRVHLLDVPRAKVISTLNERAGKYWFDPSSSDCRIYVPIPPKKAGPLSPVGTGESSESQTSSWPPAPDAPKHVEGITAEERNVVNTRHHYKSRRGSQPDQEELPVLVFHVHRDYLVTQSTLLRSLLTATSPTRPTFPRSPNTPQGRSFPTPVLRMPKERTLRGTRVLPQRDGEPVSIYMPIPDPASFGLVLHWLYWGDTPTIERALSQGLATWQGVVKNIEYLALDDSIKRVIGKWWRTWVKTDAGRKSESGSIDRKPSVSDTELSLSKRNGGRRGFSVESDGTSPSTDEEREEDGMEVDLQDGVVVKEEDDGGVGDLLKNL